MDKNLIKMEFTNKTFDEDNSDFYDLEYFLGLEYRYLSGAHSSRVKNIFKHLKKLELKGKRVLDVGCGIGFFTNKMLELGANVVGCDYSRYAVKFAKERYPKLKIIQHSAYEINLLGGNWDLITSFDVIEHLGRPEVFLRKAFQILKPNGKLVISTDNESYLFSRSPLNRLDNFLLRTSSSGRAYRLIKKVESRRKQFKNYHRGHINVMSNDALIKKINQVGFQIKKVAVCNLVSIPILDIFLKILPLAIRGNHQLIIAAKRKR